MPFEQAQLFPGMVPIIEQSIGLQSQKRSLVTWATRSSPACHRLTSTLISAMFATETTCGTKVVPYATICHSILYYTLHLAILITFVGNLIERAVF